MQTVLISPIITERSMADAQKGKFTFAVAISATKTVVKKAVEEQFKVNVLKVSTVTVKGRTKRVGKKRTEKVISPWKKAIVALQEGQKIELFDLGGNK